MRRTAAASSAFRALGGAVSVDVQNISTSSFEELASQFIFMERGFISRLYDAGATKHSLCDTLQLRGIWSERNALTIEPTSQGA